MLSAYETGHFTVGFELGTGDPVGAEIHHLAIFGLTQRAGKTTGLEAFISRLPPEFHVLVFRTKRGDLGFENATRIPFFFRERTDWQFVEGLISAHLLEKARIYRGDIMRACQGATTLLDVWNNVKEFLKNSRAGSWPEKIYTELDQYFSEIVPAISQLDFSRDLFLEDKVNLMDLEDLSPAMQQLLISAAVDRIMEARENTIVVLPEGRDFIPGDRRTPANLAIENLVRKGATLHNFLSIDSQSLTGLDLNVMRNVGVWIFGRQDLDLEIERTAKAIPGGIARADDVKSLRTGQFYVVQEGKARKVYVWPSWLSQSEAVEVAKGAEAVPRPQSQKELVRAPVSRKADSKVSEVELTDSKVMEQLQKMQQEIENLKKKNAQLESEKQKPTVAEKPGERPFTVETETRAYELVIREKGTEYRKFTTAGFPGRILYILSQSDERSATRDQIILAAAEKGWRLDKVNTARQIGVLEKDGLIIRNEDMPIVFRLPLGVNVKVEGKN